MQQTSSINNKLQELKKERMRLLVEKRALYAKYVVELIVFALNRTTH